MCNVNLKNGECKVNGPLTLPAAPEKRLRMVARKEKKDTSDAIIWCRCLRIPCDVNGAFRKHVNVDSGDVNKGFRQKVNRKNAGVHLFRINGDPNGSPMFYTVQKIHRCPAKESVSFACYEVPLHAVRGSAGRRRRTNRPCLRSSFFHAALIFDRRSDRPFGAPMPVGIFDFNSWKVGLLVEMGHKSGVRSR